MCVSGYMDIRRITKASDQQLNKLFESKITSTTANLKELVFIDYTGQTMRIVDKVKVKQSFDKHCLIEFPRTNHLPVQMGADIVEPWSLKLPSSFISFV